MRQHERLAEKVRNSRRTIADALMVLYDKVDFAEKDRAEISIGLLKLPSAEVVGVLQIILSRPATSRGRRRKSMCPEGIGRAHHYYPGAGKMSVSGSWPCLR
jgi:hypothetical protein